MDLMASKFEIEYNGSKENKNSSFEQYVTGFMDGIRFKTDGASKFKLHIEKLKKQKNEKAKLTNESNKSFEIGSDLFPEINEKKSNDSLTKTSTSFDNKKEENNPHNNSKIIINENYLCNLEKFLKNIPYWNNNLSIEISETKIKYDDFDPLIVYGRKSFAPPFYAVIGCDKKEKIYLFDEFVDLKNDSEPEYVTLVVDNIAVIEKLCLFINQQSWINLHYALFYEVSDFLVNQIISKNLLKTNSFRIGSSKITDKCLLFNVAENIEIDSCNYILNLKLKTCKTIIITKCASLISIGSESLEEVKLIDCGKFKISSTPNVLDFVAIKCKKLNAHRTIKNITKLKKLVIEN
jgi:hypothetical protein